MRLLIPITLALVLAASAAPARAAWTTQGGWSFPTQRVANNAMVESANQGALAFWHDRGVYPNPHVTYMLVDTSDDLGDAEGRTDEMTGTVWLTAREVRDAQSETPRGRFLTDYSFREDLFTVIAHELGHVAGLRFTGANGPYHSETGLMSPDTATPWAARVWRRGLDAQWRAKHPRHRRAR